MFENKKILFIFFILIFLIILFIKNYSFASLNFTYEGVGYNFPDLPSSSTTSSHYFIYYSNSSNKYYYFSTENTYDRFYYDPSCTSSGGSNGCITVSGGIWDYNFTPGGDKWVLGSNSLTKRHLHGFKDGTLKLIYSNKDILYKNSTEVFFSVSDINKPIEEDEPENDFANFKKFNLPSRDVLYNYTIIDAWRSQYDGSFIYTLITSTDPFVITEPSCSDCLTIHNDYCTSDFNLNYCYKTSGKCKVFDFNPNSPMNLYALHNQPSDKNSFYFEGSTYYNGWRYSHDEVAGIHEHRHDDTILLYNSNDTNLNSFSNVENHFKNSFSSYDLDMKLLDMYSDISTWNYYYADFFKVSESYSYDIIYKANNKYFWLSTNQPVKINSGGCSLCLEDCRNPQNFLDFQTNCKYSGEDITYCINTQNGDDIIYCMYDPTTYPEVNSYNDINTDLFTLIFKEENVDDFRLHFHNDNNFQIIYSSYDIQSDDGTIIFNQNDYMNYVHDVVDNFGEYTYYKDYNAHFENEKDNFFIALFKKLFIPSEERLIAISNVVSSKFSFIDTIKNTINTISDIFNNLKDSPTLVVRNINSKYYNGDLTYIDMSWYSPFKEYGDNIITAIIYIFFIFRLYNHIPNIINGVSNGYEIIGRSK